MPLASFTPSEIAQTRKMILFAEVRLAEYEKMVEKALRPFDTTRGKQAQGDRYRSIAERILKKYENQLNRALQKAEELKAKSEEKAKEVSEKIQATTSKHLQVLQENLAKAPEAAKEGLEKAIEASKKGIERIQEKIKKEEGTSSIIEIVSPRGGEKWLVGSSQIIQWAGGNGNSVAIILEPHSYGASEVMIAEGVPDSGSYTWFVPANSVITDTNIIRIEQPVDPNLGPRVARSNYFAITDLLNTSN